MTSGRIIKNFNGYYYVETDNGIVTCKIKGKMKQERFSAVTGDMVELLPAIWWSFRKIPMAKA